MIIQLDGRDKIFFYIEFPLQKDDTITVTWDWQFVSEESLGMDLGFAISDKANMALNDSPYTEWNEQGCLTRMAGEIDARNGDLVGGGSWAADEALPYKDGVPVSMRMVIEMPDWYFSLYGTREGEEEVLIAEEYSFRLMPSETNNGVNSLTMWCHGGDPEASVILDNILIVGSSSVESWDLY